MQKSVDWYLSKGFSQKMAEYFVSGRRIIINVKANSDFSLLLTFDNNEKKIFDMKKIIQAYRKHILYHTTYFNAVKQYINSLTDIDKINEFNYGLDISFSVKNPTLRKILEEGGSY